MRILDIRHNDFNLYVECNSYETIKRKASLKQNTDNGTSYTWSKGVNHIYAFSESNAPLDIKEGEIAPVLFFENTVYSIIIDYSGKGIEKVSFYSPIKTINESFSLFNKILFGTINFNNDIGRSCFELKYTKDNKSHSFKFSFEVFPIKLNYREDIKHILNDIEAEYKMLVLDFLHKTYQNFQLENISKDNPDIIWWSIFSNIQKELIGACKMILNKPMARLVKEETYSRADHIKRLSPVLEEELNRNKENTRHLYRIETKRLSSDTTENRFLKYTLIHISRRFDRIKDCIIKRYNGSLSQEYKDGLDKNSDELRLLRNHPFFNTVGEYKGITQESLVLQRGVGYSTIYKDWLILSSAYTLFEGMEQIETKNIATLYEIWCFIEVKKILKEKLGVEPVNLCRAEINKQFVYEFAKGSSSKIIFRKENGTEVELYYNPKTVTDNTLHSSIKGTVALTTAQKPDIVMQITRYDLTDNYKLTYLFDAKYRIGTTDSSGTDIPPDDAINQMHRYRDAIYYTEQNNNNTLKKEVIGGYILFPGDGKQSSIEEARFYESIDKVNIGAFPLVPNHSESRILLENFIEETLHKSTSDILENVITQKGTEAESINGHVFIGIVPQRDPRQSMFENRTISVYHTGASFPKNINLANFKYFAPYISGSGIRDYYKIEGVYAIPRNEIYERDSQLHQNEKTIRLVIKLGSCSYINENENYYNINRPFTPNEYFRLTSLDKLRSACRNNNTIECFDNSDYESF